MNSNQLTDIIPVRASLDIDGTGGCIGVCPNGQSYPLEKNFGPCRIEVTGSDIMFGDPVDLDGLDMGEEVVFVLDTDGGFRLWTLMSWFTGALRKRDRVVRNHQTKHERDQARQQASRKNGQRRGREITNHRRTQDAPSAAVTGDGYRALNRAHDEATTAFAGTAFARLEWAAN